MTPDETVAALYGATHAYTVKGGETVIVYYGYYNGQLDDGRPVFQVVAMRSTNHRNLIRDPFKIYFDTEAGITHDIQPLPIPEQTP